MIAREGDEMVLTGMDGSNPLGYLAALGMLRTLGTAWPDRDVRMGWTVALGAWRPFLSFGSRVDPDEVVETLEARVPRTDDLFPPRLRSESERVGGGNKWKDKLRFPTGVFAGYARERARRSAWDMRTDLDYMAGWATDGVVDPFDGTEVARRTMFDFTSGQQSFIDLIDKLARSVGADHIRNALFGPWQYTPDPGISLRWDPIDEGRQYALHAIDPADGSKNPIVSVPGANLLAAAGLVYFPVIPGKSGAEQPGLRRSGRVRTFRWPIWAPAVSMDGARYVIGFGEVYEDSPDRAVLTEMGIAAVFQANIVQPSGRYRNFAPARAL